MGYKFQFKRQNPYDFYFQSNLLTNVKIPVCLQVDVFSSPKRSVQQILYSSDFFNAIQSTEKIKHKKNIVVLLGSNCFAAIYTTKEGNHFPSQSNNKNLNTPSKSFSKITQEHS